MCELLAQRPQRPVGIRIPLNPVIDSSLLVWSATHVACSDGRPTTGPHRFQINEVRLAHFLWGIEDGYRSSNPYHSR